MSEREAGPALDPGQQVLLSFDQRTNIVNYLPETVDEAVIVAIRATPEEVDTTLQAQAIDPMHVVVIPVGLDNPTYQGVLELTEVVRPSDLATLGRRITDRLEETDGTRDWLVIDDLIVPLMYSGDERVLSFLRSIANRVRQNDIKAIYGIERNAVSARTYNQLSAICEYRVDLTAD